MRAAQLEDACCNDFNRKGRVSFCSFVLFRKLAISFFQWQYSAAWYLCKKYTGCHAEDTDELLACKGFIKEEYAAESAEDHFQTEEHGGFRGGEIFLSHCLQGVSDTGRKYACI